MAEVQCFWVEPTGMGYVQLRRYIRQHDSSGGWTCADGWHEAKLQLPERVAIQRTDEGFIAPIDEQFSHTDPRWPSKCDGCDYAFFDEDVWQVNQMEEWRRPDTGAIVSINLREMPPGAMWDAFWWRHNLAHTYPDGINLMVQLPTPETYWHTDGHSSDGGPGWERTGDPKAWPPTVTATPSILTPTYHGWLRDGKLVDA